MPEPVTVLVAGDTRPNLEVTVRRRGAVVDLTGAAVTARITREGSATITGRPLTVINAAAGVARLTWQAGDLVDNAGTPARYELEFTVTRAADDVETSPVPHVLTVRPRTP